jgi:enediyne biosynthesis protein E4
MAATVAVLSTVVASTTWALNQESIPRIEASSPAWTEWDTQFKHELGDDSWPFHGIAALRIDGVVHLWAGGGPGQQDVLMRLGAKELEVVARLGEGPSFGAQSIDLDGDDDTDLLVAREDGLVVYWNEDGQLVEEGQGVGCETGTPFNVAVADVNGDGFADIHIACFVGFEDFRSGVFNDPAHVAPNRLLLGAEDGWTDATADYQLAGTQNSFLSAFVDLDLDGRPDLVVANNTGRIELYHNDGGQYSLFGFEGHGYWMGLAIGDLDADGDQDLVFSNVGSSIPAPLLKGDLTDEQSLEPRWMVIWNDGARRYRAQPLSGLGFGWGVAAGDVDSDGDLDLVATQNYRKWPLHHLLPLSGKTLLWDGEAYASADLGLSNPLFGQSPLFVDLDQDGLEDVVMSNPGSVLRAFRNPGDPTRAVTVRLQDTLENQGTRVTARMADGHTATWAVTGGGFMSDGLADRVVVLPEGAERVLIERPGELPQTVELP